MVWEHLFLPSRLFAHHPSGASCPGLSGMVRLGFSFALAMANVSMAAVPANEPVWIWLKRDRQIR